VSGKGQAVQQYSWQAPTSSIASPLLFAPFLLHCVYLAARQWRLTMAATSLANGQASLAMGVLFRWVRCVW